MRRSCESTSARKRENLLAEWTDSRSGKQFDLLGGRELAVFRCYEYGWK